MLTTIDNPFDPFEDFNSWYMFDVLKGYNSSSYLARIAKTSEHFTQMENEEELERAIDEIIQHDFLGLYVKVKK